jgi:hypothetical protein
LTKRLRLFFNPLRLFSSLAIMGDVSLILSGSYFLNPLRSAVAVIGLCTHAVGVTYGSAGRLRFLRRSVAASDFVMGAVLLCGLAYSVSGTNILGFEAAPRYAEIVLGLLICLGAGSSLTHRPNWAAIFFSVGPLFHMTQAFETLLTQDKFDLFQMMAGICFFLSGVASRTVKGGV